MTEVLIFICGIVSGAAGYRGWLWFTECRILTADEVQLLGVRDRPSGK